jgi:hypothetical protein
MGKHLEDAFGTFYEPLKREPRSPFYGQVANEPACFEPEGHSKKGRRIWKVVRRFRQSAGRLWPSSHLEFSVKI